MTLGAGHDVGGRECRRVDRSGDWYYAKRPGREAFCCHECLLPASQEQASEAGRPGAACSWKVDIKTISVKLCADSVLSVST